MSEKEGVLLFLSLLKSPLRALRGNSAEKVEGRRSAMLLLLSLLLLPLLFQIQLLLSAATLVIANDNTNFNSIVFALKCLKCKKKMLLSKSAFNCSIK